ncbi:hypothetical protein GCM10007860_12270 [Chitiniphilus shinanonensis]|uniref:Uncharacterized protein n=1 Tax=Chitiniphilus shinanonensis TaxID=553088 RepID=A0ABQ6BRX0_9NEIS|nr:hypothetical protein [Chitiniphilus shinanonensis]GLS04081.1 hypothetical protein GCM10007860_12270 [Chitiniphilus shinanonensis]
MFALLRFLVIVLVLLVGWSAFKYQRTRDPFWLRLIRWSLAVALVTGVVGVLGLIVQRLAET